MINLFDPEIEKVYKDAIERAVNKAGWLLTTWAVTTPDKWTTTNPDFEPPTNEVVAVLDHSSGHPTSHLWFLTIATSDIEEVEKLAFESVSKWSLEK